MFFRPSQASRFEKLVRSHLQPLYQFAYRLCGSRTDAEDLVQDVMVKLFPQTDKMETIEQLRPWLKRVLYHQFVDHSRYRARQPDLALALVTDEEDDPLVFLDRFGAHDDGPEAHAERSRLQTLIQEVLCTLPPDQRVLLILHYVEGWSQEEISGFMEIPVGTIKSRLHRSRADLKQRLQRKMEPFVPSQRLEDRG